MSTDKKMTKAERDAAVAEYDAAIAAGKIPVSEAAEMLTLGEIGRIEKHYGQHFGSDEMSGMSYLAGVIWAHQRRKPGAKYDWPDVEKMTLREAQDYFAPDPIEIDPDDPETESGKDE